MKYALSLVLAAFVTTAAAAQDADEKAMDDLIVSAENVDLDTFRWVKRPLVVFADTPDDPRFNEQMEYLRGGISALRARDVIVITDTDPAARSDVRRELRPRGFGLVGIAKDGAIFLRKPTPWAIREITRSIDKLPTRQQELREQGTGS
ncbi:DUF4174 domain-containing protein [Roseovarius tibetensis]|uniref:DUF4174 domain-containing protein n=1 Tax=Roseovarius tibetensis TaxID=2685897 RepID=UPI003D7F58F1